MSWYSPLRNLWPWWRDDPTAMYAEEKASAAGPEISAHMVGRPVWTPRRYDSLADESYVRNPVAYRCIKLIASSAAAAPWLLKDRRGKAIEDHDILDLLKRPAPMVGGATLFEALYAYLLMQGNTYLEGVGPDRKPPRELWTHRPDRMKVIPGQYGLPAGFEYEANGQKRTWEVDPLTGTGPILHIKEFHPLNDWYGLGRTEPAAYGIDRHNAAAAHNKALLDNGARPSGALVLKPVTVNGQTTYPPQDTIDQAEASLKARHGGPTKAGKPMVLGGDVNWLEMGLSPKDMDFGIGKDDAARDICVSYGVPHILIVPGQSTYNNIREAKLELYEDTVLPLIDKVVDQLDAWLCPQFGDGLKLSVDLDEIPALEPRRESKRKSVLDLKEAGIIDDDEAREALQYGPRKPEAVKKVDAQVLTALVNAADKDSALFEPLLRYMASVGLVEPGTTPEQLLARARDLLETIEPDDDELDAADPQSPTPPEPPAAKPNGATQ